MPVLIPLYDKRKDQPYAVDLPKMWRELGVERAGDTVKFIDSAAMALTRDAITFGQNAVGSVTPAHTH